MFRLLKELSSLKELLTFVLYTFFLTSVMSNFYFVNKRTAFDQYCGKNA